MTLHRNARTCPNSRRLIADRVLGGGWTLAAAAEAAGVSVPTARKWVRRFRELGDAGLRDRSSAPKRIPHRTPPERERAILSLRALRRPPSRSRRPRDGPFDGFAGAQAQRPGTAAAAVGERA